jgi:hypothetical protein
MSLPALRDHTAGVIARLQALGLTVGDGEAPAGVDPPYVVAYPITGGASYGVLGAPDDDAELVYQVTCVGTTRLQAQWLEDKAMGLLAGFTVTGRSIARVDVENYGGLFRDDSKSPPVYSSVPRFRLYTTPA